MPPVPPGDATIHVAPAPLPSHAPAGPHPPDGFGPSDGPPADGQGKKRRGKGLIVLLAVLALVGLVGAAVWFLVLDDSADEPPGGGGDTVELDGLIVSDSVGVYVVSEDGSERTLIVAQDVGDIFDDGMGGLIWQADQPIASGSGPAPTVDDPALTTIWHLPAGEPEPVELISSDDPAELRYDLRSAGVLGDSVVIVFVRGPDPARGGADPLEHELVVRDVESGDETVIDDGVRTVVADGRVTYSPTVQWVSLNDDNLAFVAADRDAASSSWVVLDADLEPVDGSCTDLDPEDAGGCPTGGKLDATLQVVETKSSDDGTRVTGYAIGDPLRDGEVRTVDVEIGGDLTGWRGDRLFDVWDGRAVHSWLPDGGSEQFATLVTDLETGETTELDAEGLVRFLRAPLVRPAT